LTHPGGQDEGAAIDGLGLLQLRLLQGTLVRMQTPALPGPRVAEDLLGV
jgi:hypothetical protein